MNRVIGNRAIGNRESIVDNRQSQGIGNRRASAIARHRRSDGIGNRTASAIGRHRQSDGIGNRTASAIARHRQSGESAIVIVSVERIVTIPVDVVWQLIEPVEALPAWYPPAVKAQRLSGTGLGRRQRMTTRRRGKDVEIDQEVIEYQPNATLAWKETGGRGAAPASTTRPAATVTVRLESIGPGTRVVLEARLAPATAGEALALRLGGKGKIRKSLSRALDRLQAAGG